MQTRRPVAVDIFAGAGGLAEGFLAAGIDVAVAVERHPHAALTNAFNHSDCSVICGDIAELDSDVIRAEVKKRTGKSRVDIVAGGPPCQGFSSAGKQDDNDPRNQLIHEFVRVVDELSPTCFVFENVPAITEASNGKVIQRMLDDFWDMGFKIFGVDNKSDYYPCSYPVIDSSWFGVPQARKRLILVGWKKGLDCFNWLDDSMLIPTSRRANEVNIYDAISDLDFLASGFECHSYQKPPSSNYQMKRRANSAILLNHLASDHRKEQLVDGPDFLLMRGRNGRRRFPSPDHRTGVDVIKRKVTEKLAHLGGLPLPRGTQPQVDAAPLQNVGALLVGWCRPVANQIKKCRPGWGLGPHASIHLRVRPASRSPPIPPAGWNCGLIWQRGGGVAGPHRWRQWFGSAAHIYRPGRS